MLRLAKLIGLGTALALITLAAGNSGQVGLAQAGTTVTVCASGCDFSKIQAAIDAVQTAGSTIQVQAGTYTENLTITGKQGLTLQGADSNAVTLDGSAGVAVQSPPISIQRSQQITVKGLKIINSRRGVHAIGTTGLVLANNSFQNNLRQSIVLEQQSEAQLTGNLIQNTQPDKDGKQGQGVNMADSKAMLRDNTITGNALGGIQAQGASAQSGSTITIEQNTISDNGYFGAALFNASTGTIDGNTIARNVEEGIYVGDSAHAQITNNQIMATKRNSQANCCGFGINLRYNAQGTIQGNTISKNESRGIMLQESAQATIQKNTINDNNAQGIRLNGNSSATIDGNTITGNVQSGLYLYDTAQATITNNQINSTKFDAQNQYALGVWLAKNSSANIEKNTVSQNAARGIRLDDAAHATIRQNTISTNLRSGISLYGTARATLDNNTISGNATEGVDLFENSQATITNNQIKNNVIGIQVGAGSFAGETVQAEISNNTIRNNSNCGVFSDSDSGITITGQSNDVGTLCGDKSKFPSGFGGGK
jgi:parallel beta-helix repeat protein